MRKLALVSLFVMASAAVGAAAEIDLSKPWGNASGCVNKDGQEAYAEDMRLLTRDSIVTATTACAVTDVLPGKAGAIELNATCQAEGEESGSPFRFIVSRSRKHPSKLVIQDAGGGMWGEVARCRSGISR